MNESKTAAAERRETFGTRWDRIVAVVALLVFAAFIYLMAIGVLDWLVDAIAGFFRWLFT